MKLYLSSFRFGNRPEELPRLVGSGLRAAAIMNARDGQPDGHRRQRTQEELAKLDELGFQSEELDLRKYFGNASALKRQLDKYGLIWVSGGNTFLLRQAMKQSGFDALLLEGLREDRFAYAGYSAAGCVLSPSLDAYSIVDDPKQTEQFYNLPTDYTGMGILDYYLEPHYKSNHPEGAAVNREIAQLEARGLSYKTLRDGEVLVIDGSDEIILT